MQMPLLMICFSRYEKMQEFGSKKSLPETKISEGLFCQFFHLHVELCSGGAVGWQLQWPMLYSIQRLMASAKLLFTVFPRGHKVNHSFERHFLTNCPTVLGMSIPRSGKDFADRQFNMLLLN